MAFVPDVDVLLVGISVTVAGVLATIVMFAVLLALLLNALRTVSTAVPVWLPVSVTVVVVLLVMLAIVELLMLKMCPPVLFTALLSSRDSAVNVMGTPDADVLLPGVIVTLIAGPITSTTVMLLVALALELKALTARMVVLPLRFPVTVTTVVVFVAMNATLVLATVKMCPAELFVFPCASRDVAV